MNESKIDVVFGLLFLAASFAACYGAVVNLDHVWRAVGCFILFGVCLILGLGLVTSMLDDKMLASMTEKERIEWMRIAAEARSRHFGE